MSFHAFVANALAASESFCALSAWSLAFCAAKLAAAASAFT